MKRIGLIIALGLIVASVCGACGEHTAEPINSLTFSDSEYGDYVNFYGRCRTDETVGAVCFSNSSSGFEIRFKGTKLTAEINSTRSKSSEAFGTPSVYIFVDGETSYKKSEKLELNGMGTVEICELVSGLKDGEHTVKVLKCTQAKYGEARLLKLTTDGKFLSAPVRPALRAELIGDSILSGCEVMGEIGSLDSGLLSNENSLASYGYIASSKLGAEINAVCRAGALVSGYNGLPSIPDYYGLYDEYSDKAWDFTAYVPDFVIIDLGTNDLGNGVPAEFFTLKYREFVVFVRSKYPGAAIFCASGAMNSLCDKPVSDMVSKINAGGDENVYYFKLPEMYNGGHPRERQHKSNGEALAVFISETLGYTDTV